MAEEFPHSTIPSRISLPNNEKILCLSSAILPRGAAWMESVSSDPSGEILPLQRIWFIVCFYFLASTFVLGKHILSWGRVYAFSRGSNGWSQAEAAVLLWSSVLALSFGKKCLDGDRTKDVVICGVFSGLAILSHLESGLFTISSLGLLFLCYGWRRGGLNRVLLASSVTFLCAAPWVFIMIFRHGLSPFIDASYTSQWAGMISGIKQVLQFQFTGEHT
jgi:hypothetical protein